MSCCCWEKEERGQLEGNRMNSQVVPASRGELWLDVGHVGHVRGTLRVCLVWVVRCGVGELKDCCFQESSKASGARVKVVPVMMSPTLTKASLRVWYI